MTQRRQEINVQFNQLIDCGIIAFSFWLAYTLRSEIGPLLFPDLPQIPPMSRLLWMMAIIVPFTPVILEAYGYYQDIASKTVMQSLKQFFKTLMVIGVLIGTCVVFFKWTAHGRTVLLLLVLVAGSLLLLKEAGLRRLLVSRSRSGRSRERLLIAGCPDEIRNFLEEFEEGEGEVVAVLNIADESVETLSSMLHEHAVTKVVFAAGHVHFGKVGMAIRACEQEGVEAWLAADFIETRIARTSFESFGQRPMLVFRSTPEISWATVAKRFIDGVGAIILLLVSLPVWIVAAVGIKLSSGGPVFFRQKRSGLHGMPFTVLKFRTMHSDAEARREELEERNEMQGPVFKVSEDPRVFRFGRWLRKLSIDELPQLINVLRGEMSLVGPRPLPVYEVDRIANSSQRRRLSVKPGLTCLWQVKGRSNIRSFDDWVKLDLQYIDNWSIWLDLKIMARTVPSVLIGSGAS